jgi:nitric oxide reductase activation protein
MSRGTDGSQADRNPLSDEQTASRARAIQSERQKRIVDDTAKLLQLANELKIDVDKSSKDELSLDVVRKADEIERLAHEVKLRMKG